MDNVQAGALVEIMDDVVDLQSRPPRFLFSKGEWCVVTMTDDASGLMWAGWRPGLLADKYRVLAPAPSSLAGWREAFAAVCGVVDKPTIGHKPYEAGDLGWALLPMEAGRMEFMWGTRELEYTPANRHVTQKNLPAHLRDLQKYEATLQYIALCNQQPWAQAVAG